jgi:hypothetical protein
LDEYMILNFGCLIIAVPSRCSQQLKPVFLLHRR